MKLYKTILCFAVAAITLSLGAYFEHIHYRVGGMYIPHSWGIVKDLFDPILIIIFLWAGWIFLIPLLLALLFRLSIPTIFCLWIIATLVMGVADTVISFPIVSTVRIIKGVFVYTYIFGSLLIPAVILKLISKEQKNES
jgi:hypothetical protein